MKRYCFAGLSVLGLMALSAVMVWTIQPKQAAAHCQVPCGIYDDPARIERLREDTRTIAKAIKNINEMAGAHSAQGVNQAVRWVTTKEDHASHIIDVMANYFLAQRVKPVASGSDGRDEYVDKLERHHAVIVAAMQAKQNASQKYADDLMHAIDGIAGYYTK
jgi:nickel superoxide dismutase